MAYSCVYCGAQSQREQLARYKARAREQSVGEHLRPQRMAGVPAAHSGARGAALEAARPAQPACVFATGCDTDVVRTLEQFAPIALRVDRECMCMRVCLFKRRGMSMQGRGRMARRMVAQDCATRAARDAGAGRQLRNRGHRFLGGGATPSKHLRASRSSNNGNPRPRTAFLTRMLRKHHPVKVVRSRHIMAAGCTALVRQPVMPEHDMCSRISVAHAA